MENKILEIIFKNSAGSTENITDGLYYKITVKEIATMFREFWNWFMWQDEIGTEGCIRKNDGTVVHLDDDNTEHTLDELFDYWFNNIKQK
jgi:hypothetical protein